MGREWACEKADKRTQFRREKQYGGKEGEESENEARGKEVDKRWTERKGGVACGSQRGVKLGRVGLSFFLVDHPQPTVPTITYVLLLLLPTA